MPRLLLPAILAALSMAACANPGGPPRVPDPAWAADQWPGTTGQDLTRGRDLFVARCQTCHALPVPAAKAPDVWPDIVAEMADRAHLSPDDRVLVQHYLGAASQESRATGG